MSREIDLSADDRNAPLSQNARLLLRALSWYEADPDEAYSITEIPMRKLARYAGLTAEQATEAAKELAARDLHGFGMDGETVVLRG